jgi:putative SOS response-associated peptidase YedK
MFARRQNESSAKILRLKAADWRRGEVLRITPRRRWDANPSARCMIIRRRDYGELALTAMRWGLAPTWEHDVEARPLINVRAETVAEHIEWRRLLNSRRCLVPTDQFFEWKRVGGAKTKEYAFKLRSRRPMMIAALWSKSPSPSGASGDCFAYISCRANRLVGLIHDRMPVILDEGEISTWLNPDAPLETLLALLRPLDHSLLELQSAAEPKPKPEQPSLFASRAA